MRQSSHGAEPTSAPSWHGSGKYGALTLDEEQVGGRPEAVEKVPGWQRLHELDSIAPADTPRRVTSKQGASKL